MTLLQVHSTRLFPKNLGAHRYEITGIAKKCDWVILSDRRDPHIFLWKSNDTEAPQTIFLSMRDHSQAINYFRDSILPTLKDPFVLISGSEDITIPNQIDKRSEPMSDDLRLCIDAILASPLLRLWAVENLDEVAHPKFFPLPVGMIFSDEPKIREDIEVPEVPKLSSRPTRVLCGHRVRDGAQWETRRRVTEIAQANWTEWCTCLDAELSEPDYVDLLKQHAFVICAEGGGLDPSPKAWQAILYGAVPIIKKSALYGAYRHLPVVFVDSWSPDSLCYTKLQNWHLELIQQYDLAANRREVLRRLTIDYWWDYIIGLSVEERA